ncbi:DUF3857 domain-containing protein [Qipengyuania sp. 1NDH17]|uniref:DUF3857 domain-containing protein n=2 Tax=Qipengyuania polymorpha TaxID=2867234 RepID=A0ABS7ITR5_9SPHN|nr:DUF3857 domain-containing protein [Qipengyuania polymorpha]
MKSTHAILLAALLASASPLAAQEKTISTGPVPAWVQESEPLPVPEDASGMFFLRRQDTQVHFDDHGQWNFNAQHLAILHPQALQAGNLGIAWNPAAGDAVVHRVLVHRDGETIDVLEKTQFEILRREDQLEQAMLDGILTAVMRVPDLRVGDELELAWTAPAHDPTLEEQSFGVLFLADSAPPGRVRMSLTWEDGQKPNIQVPEGLREYTTQTSDRLLIAADNLPTRTMPKDAPPRYAFHRVAQFSDFESWREVSSTFDTLFDNASQLSASSSLKEEAARIARSYSTDKERAAAALELVQQQVRYIFVGLNGGNFTPATADETWERRYGDCKGKTALLLALLAEMDIDARAVLVNNSGGDDGLDGFLPNPGMFDHVLVQADFDGETYWLDGTLPAVVGMQTRPLFEYRWVLPLASEGSELVSREPEPLALPTEMGLYELDARDGFDVPARKTYTNVTRGPAGVLEYIQHSAMTADQIETSYRSNLTGGGEWDEITSVTYRYDKDTLASVLTISGVGPIDWDDDGDGARSLVLPGGGFSPPNRRRRSSEQDQTAPFYSPPSYSCHSTTLRLPRDTDLDNWGFNSTFDTMLFGRVYYRMMEKRDDMTIRMVRGSRNEVIEISPERAERDNGRIEQFDNSKANITYDPERTMNSWGNLSPVPAVYEFDWVSPAAPCLPEDLR